MNKQYLHGFINDHCIFRCPPGYAIRGLPQGNLYRWQFYLRRAIFWQWAMAEIAEWLLDNHEDGVQYAAMETAGPPMLAALQTLAHQRGRVVPGFAIRKEPKKYGLLNMIEGFSTPDMPVIILDDLANSKSTITRAARVCKNIGLNVIGAKTIVNKKMEDNVDGLPVESIFMINEFDMRWEDYYANRQLPDVDALIEQHKGVLVWSPYVTVNSGETPVANLSVQGS